MAILSVKLVNSHEKNAQEETELKHRPSLPMRRRGGGRLPDFVSLIACRYYAIARETAASHTQLIGAS